MIDDLIHREHVRDGEFAIHLLDHLLNGKCEALGIACGADEESSAGLCACVDREIHRRLRRLRQFVSGIAHDADYLVAMMTQGDEVLADRVLIWKILPHEPSADDDFVRAVETLIGTEGAPAEERDS